MSRITVRVNGEIWDVTNYRGPTSEQLIAAWKRFRANMVPKVVRLKKTSQGASRNRGRVRSGRFPEYFGGVLIR